MLVNPKQPMKIKKKLVKYSYTNQFNTPSFDRSFPHIFKSYKGKFTSKENKAKKTIERNKMNLEDFIYYPINYNK